jgi:hypothetical protein
LPIATLPSQFANANSSILNRRAWASLDNTIVRALAEQMVSTVPASNSLNLFIKPPFVYVNGIVFLLPPIPKMSSLHMAAWEFPPMDKS